ncbi:MAG: hypothetical protein LBE33_03140, partial [Zoogloeaceae bacterium]|nr:hypothetical protein [Zoogloeaceae bacterium]
MNRQYKTIFNRSLGIFQVVSELAKARSKVGQSQSAAPGIIHRNRKTFPHAPFALRTLMALVGAALLGMSPAHAQVNIILAPDEDISDLYATYVFAADTNWFFNGNAVVNNDNVRLPDLPDVNAFIDDTSNGVTVGMTSAPVSFIASGSVDLTIQGDFTFTRTVDHDTDGGIFNIPGDITINSADGTFTAINSGVTGKGGVIYSDGAVEINGGKTTLIGNHATSQGGAIYSAQKVTITGDLTADGNIADTAGGAIYSAGDVTIGSLATTLTTISNNFATGGNGGAIWVGGNLLLDASGGDMTFRGNTDSSGANAIYFNNTSGGGTATATATFNVAANHSIIFYDPIENRANSINDVIGVNKTGAGSVIFDGADYLASQPDRWSQIFGITTVQAGSFVIRNNAIYGITTGLVATAGTSFVVNSGATLAGGGDLAANRIGTVRADTFTLNGDLNIAGSAAPGTASGGFSTFNVVSSAGGGVNFGAGSQIFFNTLLNDASTQLSDVLVLDLAGTATSGTANIIVNNVGTVGDGAITTGSGIELVHVVGNNGSTAGAFALGNPGGYVAAGPYAYELFKGGLDGSGNADPTLSENWYLRSTLDCTLDPTHPACPNGTGGDVPNYRPETSLYSVLPSMFLGYSSALLDTLHERVGDEHAGARPRENESIGWTRL